MRVRVPIEIVSGARYQMNVVDVMQNRGVSEVKVRLRREAHLVVVAANRTPGEIASSDPVGTAEHSVQNGAHAKPQRRSGRTGLPNGPDDASGVLLKTSQSNLMSVVNRVLRKGPLTTATYQPGKMQSAHCRSGHRVKITRDAPKIAAVVLVMADVRRDGAECSGLIESRQTGQYGFQVGECANVAIARGLFRNLQDLSRLTIRQLFKVSQGEHLAVNRPHLRQ